MTIDPVISFGEVWMRPVRRGIATQTSGQRLCGKTPCGEGRSYQPLASTVASGDMPASDLPQWVKSNRPPPTKPGFDDMDDDIPF